MNDNSQVKPDILFTDNAAYRMNVGTNIVKDAHHATNGREEQCTKQDNPYIDPYITVNLQNVKLTSEVFIIFENYGICFKPRLYAQFAPWCKFTPRCKIAPGSKFATPYVAFICQ